MVLNPSFPGLDAPNKVSGYSKLLGDILLSNPLFGERSDLVGDLSSDLRIPTVFPSLNWGGGLPSFSPHVVNIIRVSSFKQMLWIKALRIVALVKNELTSSYLPIMREIGNSVRELLLMKAEVSDPNHPIPLVVRLCSPFPTSVGSELVNFGPKSMIKHDVSMGDTHSPVKEVCHR